MHIPLGQTPGAKTLLRMPQGASRFARHLPKCVLAILDNVYDMDTILGSTLNEPDDDTVMTCDEWKGGNDMKLENALSC